MRIKLRIRNLCKKSWWDWKHNIRSEFFITSAPHRQQENIGERRRVFLDFHRFYLILAVFNSQKKIIHKKNCIKTGTSNVGIRNKSINFSDVSVKKIILKQELKCEIPVVSVTEIFCFNCAIFLHHFLAKY